MPPGVLAEDEAARTTHAVLRALALRLSREDRRRLIHELPDGLGEDLAILDIEEGEPAAADTVGRTALELGLDREVAARRVCCVVATVRDCVTPGTWHAVEGQLSCFLVGGSAAQPGWG